MADELPPKSSSCPSTTDSNMKITPETTLEAEKKATDPSESRDSGQKKTISRRRLPRRRRCSSNKTNRDDRGSRKYRTTGSTYRPNYDAIPERPEYSPYRREYRDSDQWYQIS